jgi:hypothetical protein
MRATPFKWLLIGLFVVSFVSRPWAEALAASNSQGCGSESIAAMEFANSTAMRAIGKIAIGNTTTAKNSSGKAMLTDCVKSCAAMPMLGQAALVWSPDIWPKSQSAGIQLALSGCPPKPEIPPPISPA